MNTTNDGNFFSDVFTHGLLVTSNQSKYRWNDLQDEGHGIFVEEKDLPKTFAKTEGKSGRPNAPEKKKKELRKKGLVIATRVQPHPDTGAFGCLIFVRPNDLAASRS